MKKVLFALFAVAALASCSNTEVVELNREQIAFGDTFVDNATKADYSSGKIVKGFKVYGTVTALSNTTQIFDGADVTRGDKADGVAWDCNATPQYWLPNAEYEFAAIVDGVAEDTDGLPETIKFTVVDGNDDNLDLLYATATVDTNENAAPKNGVNTNGVVAFEFSHLLSKMQFKIVNATNQKYQVTSINVTGVAKDGVYDVVGGSWSASNTTSLTFGTTATVAGGANAPASEARQILPVAQTLAVTITYNVLDGADAVVGTLTKTGNITETFEQNTVYVVTATLSGTTIDFSLGTVDGWDPGDGLGI